MDDLEAQFDEDFVFYMSFVKPFYLNVKEPQTKKLCQFWLQKLLGTPYKGPEEKRCRNVFLLHLLLGMQENRLKAIFLDERFMAMDVVAGAARLEKDFSSGDLQFESLNESAAAFVPMKNENLDQNRTYFAWKSLENGRGAFAYFALSLEEEPAWTSHLQRKFQELVPPEYEMEKILARRKDPKERQKVLDFYGSLLQSLEDELDGTSVGKNAVLEGLLQQLENHLKKEGLYDFYANIADERARRIELLLVLHQRIAAKKESVASREELLDELQDGFGSSFFDKSFGKDLYNFPDNIWEKALKKPLLKKHFEALQKLYPEFLIERFLKLLEEHKKLIVNRMQKRHENFVQVVKKQIGNDWEKWKIESEKAEYAAQRAKEIWEIVLKHFKLLGQMQEEQVPEHTKQYEDFKVAVLDARTLVEFEEEKGRFLAEQLVLEEQPGVSNKIAEVEQANLKVLRNIRRLQGAVQMMESRKN